MTKPFDAFSRIGNPNQQKSVKCVVTFRYSVNQSMTTNSTVRLTIHFLITWLIFQIKLEEIELELFLSQI